MRQKETTSVVSVTRVLQRSDTCRNMNSLTRRRDPFNAALAESSTSKSIGKLSVKVVIVQFIHVKGLLPLRKNYEGHICYSFVCFFCLKSRAT